jgi:hypothetical protein
VMLAGAMMTFARDTIVIPTQIVARSSDLFAPPAGGGD